MIEWCIYIALLLCIAIHPKRFTIMWGVTPQPPPVCSIHLDDATAATGQRRQCAHHTPATGGEERVYTNRLLILGSTVSITKLRRLSFSSVPQSFSVDQKRHLDTTITVLTILSIYTYTLTNADTSIVQQYSPWCLWHTTVYPLDGTGAWWACICVRARTHVR